MTTELSKKYYPLTYNGYFTHLEVAVIFSRGEGYYIHVYPCSHINNHGINMISYELFAGTRWLILRCNRMSAKQTQHVMDIAKGEKPEMIHRVLTKHGLALSLENELEPAVLAENAAL